MDQNTCISIVPFQTECQCQPLQFLDILLDETLISGTIYIPNECLQNVSTINRRLPAKHNYEFLLRLALAYPVQIVTKAPHNSKHMLILSSKETAPNEDGLKTDCYLTAYYKKTLLEHNLFDSAVNSILTAAKQLNCYEQTVFFLEQMLQERPVYQYLYQGSQPFLIYTGDTICYHILSTFADCLGQALIRQGYLVEYFDLSKEPHTAAGRYIGRHFQAIIGIQTYMFSARLTDNHFLHDKINGPKYNFVFDHINTFQQHLEQTPKNLTILTLDRNYVLFGRKYYPVNVRFLPPGGIVKPFTGQKRIYPIVFIGSYFYNTAYISAQLKLLSREKRFFVNRFWLFMRKYPYLSAEEIWKLTLSYYNKTLSDEQFKNSLYQLQPFILYMAYKYRYKIIKTIVQSGLTIDVFGKSWETCPLRKYDNFVWHEKDLSTEESLAVWQQSKIALNIMTWHKNAITERIINSMLQKCAVLTERNDYLEQQFEEGKEIVFYDLHRLDKLPPLIYSLLATPEQLAAIGECAYKKALQSHTWDSRAAELIDIIQHDSFPSNCSTASLPVPLSSRRPENEL